MAGRTSTGVDGAPHRVMILLPTLNEEKGLAATLHDLPLDHLREIGYDVTVVVLDGHSTDHTVEVARAFGATVVAQQGKGKGTAMREGLAWAADHHMEYMAVLDADYTYPGSGIPPLLSLLDAGSDLVVGVRRPEAKPTTSARDIIHRVGNGLLNYLAAQMSRSPILDVCSGLWGVRVQSVAPIPLVAEGFEIEAELFLKAFRYGLHVSQMPIAYRKRVGTAKLRAARDGARICLTIFRHAWSPTDSSVEIPPPERLRSPDAPPFPDLQRIVLATDARELVVYSHPGRAAEAEALAESLRAAQLGVEVVIHPYGSINQETWGLSRAVMDVASARAGPVPILINLPGERPDTEPVAVVGLPRTRRVVYLGGENEESADTAPPFAQSGGYRLERPRGRRLGSMTLLNAALDPSPRIRELALLAANGRESGASVYQYDSAPEDGAAAFSGRARAPPPGARPQ